MLPASANTTTWQGSSSAFFATNTNWTNNAPGLGDTGVFDATASRTTVDISTVGAPTDIETNTLQFNSGAPAFTFVNQVGVLQLDGLGIVDNSANPPLFQMDAATMTFTNSASAGDAVVTSVDASTINFENSSSAGTASISGDETIFNFSNTATAGQATFTLTDTSVMNFNDSSTAGNAVINDGDDSPINFNNSSTAGNATIAATGASVVTFFDNSDGGTAAISADALSIIDFSATSGANGNNEVNVGSLSGSGSFFLGGNEVFVGGNNQSTTVSGVISDCGGGDDCAAFPLSLPTTGGKLVKVGTGTLTLTGANTYSGGTEVDGGILNISADDNLGAASTPLTFGGGTLQYGASFTLDPTRTITLNSGGGTIDTNGFSPTIGSSITGTGGLTKVGLGTLLLNGNVSYTGTTTVSSGTLQFGDGTGTNVTLSGNVIDNAALVFDPSLTSTISGDISGAGTLEITGTGHELIITGTDTASGGTTISSGVLQIGDGGAGGSISGNIANNGSLVFDEFGTGTLGGNITGTGSLIIEEGTLTLSGNNSYGGGTFIFNGTTLIVSSPGNLGTGTVTMFNGSTLEFAASGGDFTQKAFFGTPDPTFNTAGNSITWSGLLAGPGALDVIGGGELTLTNAANTYSGGTQVSGNTILDVTSDGALGTTTSTLQLGDATTAGTLQFGGSFNLSSSRPITINAGGGTIDTNGFTTTVTHAIAGTGALTKAGAGTLILTGASSYGGGTTISAGTLQLGNGGTSGSVSGNITDNATLALDRSDTVTYGQTISGAGSLSQIGSGTSILTGNDSYSGGTTISAGTLQLGNGGASGSIIGDITDNAALVADRTDTLTLSGTISGTGSLSQIGTGTTVLTGANTYSGGTTISAGTLEIGNGGTSGSISGNVADNGTLAFDRSDTVTYSGVVSGTGLLTQIGTGTLVITGSESNTGGTTIAAGTLQIGNGGTSGAVAGDVTDNGGLVFDRSDNVTYTDVISGNGTLTQAGAGDLTLTGTNTLSGDTTVATGTLTVNGSLGSSAVTVDSGATLGGTGTVGATTVHSGGTLTPGDAIGTLNVNGDLALQSGSTYVVALTPTQADKTLVSGVASVSGQLLANFQTGVNYATNTKYTLITSSGALSGSFTSLDAVNTPTGLEAVLSYDANDVYLTLISALHAADGQIHASIRTAFIDDERLIRDAVLGHLFNRHDGVAVWGEGFAAYGWANAQNSASTMTHNHSGGIVGVDAPLGYGIRAGVAGAYTSDKVAVPAHTSSATDDSGHVVVYADWSDDTFSLRGGGEYGWGTSDIVRSVPLVSEIDSDSQSSRTAQAFADASYDTMVAGNLIEPHADFVWVEAGTGAFRETGGALSALSGPGVTDSVSLGQLGVRARLESIPLGRWALTPRFDVGWQHAFSSLVPAQSVTFASNGQTSVIFGVPVTRDEATVQVGFDIAVAPNARLTLGYDGIIADKEQDHAGLIRMSWNF